MKRAPRFHRLHIEDAIVGDKVKHEGELVTIVAIEQSPDLHHWRVQFSAHMGRLCFPNGCVFTQPPT